ncbi:MAG: TrmB family transcriptional regulator [Candidatus Nanoarchaeia archaeon]
MDEKIFSEIGFTNAETKIYLALLKIGLTTAGPLLIQTGLQNSTLHKTLHKLVSSGFVSFTINGKTRYYQATDPENLLKVIKERETRFESLLPELKTMQKPFEKQEAEVYEGFKGLKNMLYDFIKEGNKGDEYLFFSFYTENPDDFDNVYNFYKEFEKERKKLGLVVRGIAPHSIKNKFKGRNLGNIRFVNFPVPLNISVFNNKVILTPWQDKQVSFMIHSKQLADSFRNYFYSIWKR